MDPVNEQMPEDDSDHHHDGSTGLRLREMLLIAGPAVLIVFAAFWFAYQFVEPAPPKQLTITSGGKTGGYYRFANRYAQSLKKAGITLNVMTSKGSLQNIERLTAEGGKAQVALMQGGISDGNKAPGVVSLGRIFLEPLWVFYRGEEPIERLSALSGKRIAIGPVGSGTRALAAQLLAKNNVAEDNASLLPLSGGNAVDALFLGEADAIFLVTAPQSPLVQKLLRDERVKLMSFAQGEAYTRIFPFLSRVTLPAGVVDLVANVPPRDITLVAAQAALVVREDLHPALIGLLVEAAKEAHGGGGLFQRIGDFPRPQDPEYPMSADAERMYEAGPSFLRRMLPFWLATFVERMFIMIVPIATILLPLFKVVPWIYDWRVRSRLLHWYSQLKRLESRIKDDATGQRRKRHLAEIEHIEDAVGAIPVPLNYSERFYELRAAIDLVRQRLVART